MAANLACVKADRKCCHLRRTTFGIDADRLATKGLPLLLVLAQESKQHIWAEVLTTNELDRAYLGLLPRRTQRKDVESTNARLRRDHRSTP